MNKRILSFVTFLSLAAALVALPGCKSDVRVQAVSPKPGLASTNSTPAVTNAAAVAASSIGIPPRPEKLKFPPLVYEPPDPKDYRVQLRAGPVVYIATNHELPLVNVVVYVHTGEYVEPVDKIGVAGLTGYLLARGGTESRTAEQLEERLAFLAAQLNSGVGETQGSVSLNLLSKDVDEGFAILREVLTKPRFQEDKLALAKQQTLQSMKERNDDSSSIQGREAGFLAYGENFWGNRYTTTNTLDPIAQADLQQFHRKWFHPDNFVVAVSGDFDHDNMLGKLEKLFADWPFKGDVPPAIPTNTVFADPGVYVVDKDVNQGRVSIMLPGIKRDNPDYFPVLIMNNILGGGGFTARIVNRVRSDEGLAYDAHSSFQGGVYYPETFTAGFQSKSRTVPFATSIILEEMKRIAEAPVSDLELNTAKRSYIDQFPRIFATKTAVVNTFAQEEFTGRYQTDPDFFKKYRARFEAVSKDDVLRVASKYIHPDRAVILVVGQEKEIMLGHPNHKEKLADLSPGGVHEVPLRDPLTMKPLPTTASAKE